MNFTEKIAEQCNGAQHCDLSSQPTYIHKCAKISDYLYVTFKCITESTIYDICQPTKRILKPTSSSSFYIKSSDFPDEYPSSLDCTCSITSQTSQQLKLEVLWFSLQDNDFLTAFNKNLTGWINPTYEIPILTNSNKIRFLTDDSLAYKGFWLQISPRKACRNNWQLVGNNCVKVFSDRLDWRSANKRCQQIGGNLLKINDVTNDLKITQYMKTFHSDIESYWLGLRKYVDASNKERWMWSRNSTAYNDVSWWPWQPVTTPKTTPGTSSDFAYPNNCVLKHRDNDGYFTTPCDSTNKNSFICQTDTVASTNTAPDIHLQCGKTADVEQNLAQQSQFNEIGIASIQNYQNNLQLPTTTPDKPRTIIPSTLETELLNQYLAVHDPKMTQNPENDPDPKMAQKPKNNPKMTQKPQNDHDPKLTPTPKNNPEMARASETKPKLNTTVLAGIVCGIGMVIVIINLAVLFICRRNLKKFLKSTKEVAKPDLNGFQPANDMLQDYFEAFSTLHNLNPNPKAQLKLLNDLNTFTLNHSHQLKTNTDDESAKLFYNTQLLKDMTLKHPEANSAFKPFTRDFTDTGMSQQHLLPMETLIRNHFIQSQASSNQYDKINHIQTGQQASQSFDNQYAHTYECLDNKTHANSKPYNLQSPNLESISQNFNVSSSSTSSSSGTSSTQQLIRNPQLQTLTPAQLTTLHDLQSALIKQGVAYRCVCGASSYGDSCAACGNSVTGTWSPDSAYYSSIPMSSYPYNQQQQQQQQQFSSFNFVNSGDNFKSHLV